MLNLLSSISGMSESWDDVAILVFLGVFTLISVFVGVWFIAVNVNKPESNVIGKLKVSGAVSIVIILGVLIRVAFLFISNGYLGTDPTLRYNNMGGMAEIYETIGSVIRRGLTSFDVKDSNIYPVPFYMFWFFGRTGDVFGAITSGSVTLGMRLLFRLPLILCDAAAAAVLFNIVKKYANSFVGLGMAAIYMFCPVFFFGTGIWGSTLSILSLLILLSLYFMTQKNFLGITICFSLALLTARDAMMFAPVFAVFAVYYFIKSLKACRKSEKLTFKQWFLDGERGLVLRLPLYLVGSLVFMYILHLPLLYSLDYSFFGWFNRLFIYPFTHMKYMGFNSLSVYNLLIKNASGINNTMPQFVYSLLFAALATALVLVVYISRKNRAIMVLVSAFTVFTLNIFYMDFAELNLLPVLAVLLFAFALIKDKRILHVFGITSLAVTLNGASVMASAGYFSTAPYSDFGLESYAGTANLSQNTFGLAMSLVCTALALLAFVYFTLIVLDVALSNKTKPFNLKDNSFGGMVKDWFRLKDPK